MLYANSAEFRYQIFAWIVCIVFLGLILKSKIKLNVEY